MNIRVRACVCVCAFCVCLCVSVCIPCNGARDEMRTRRHTDGLLGPAPPCDSAWDLCASNSFLGTVLPTCC
jgi:hypothetical protein